MSDESHDASVAVWDVPSPAVIGRPFRIKAGVTCSAGCALDGLDIEVRDDLGVPHVAARLGATPWPGTAALYWTEIELPPPVSEGQYRWHVAPSGEPRRHGFAGCFTIAAGRQPEHTVTIAVIDIIDRAPVSGVHVRVGPYRTSTDDRGEAAIAVGGGSYDVIVWKAGYEAAPIALTVSRDETVRIDLHRAAKSPEPYWM
jgi:hypothetical protein